MEMSNYYYVHIFLWSLPLLPVKYTMALSLQNPKIIQMKQSEEEKSFFG